jgi:hypothetical protein
MVMQFFGRKVKISLLKLLKKKIKTKKGKRKLLLSKSNNNHFSIFSKALINHSNLKNNNNLNKMINMSLKYNN